MRVLIIKTSSMGDVIHTLPALTDAAKAISPIEFDWVVEENFSEIPSWHPNVKNIIPMAWRRWRKNLFSAKTYQELIQFFKQLRSKRYDFIIDAQGLFKSAFITRFAKGRRVGLNAQSARESIAARFYQDTHAVDKTWHAVTRMRQLFAKALGYPFEESHPDYGIDRQRFISSNEKKYLVFLHGTTWDTKHWPTEYWIDLAHFAHDAGFEVKLPWGNEIEHTRAKKIASHVRNVTVLPKLNLAGMARVLAGATSIVAVDTGLGHLAAALDVPTVSLYGPTNPVLTGALGKSQIHLSVNYACSPCLKKTCDYQNQSPFEELRAPCFATLAPQQVWAVVEGQTGHGQ